MESKIIELEGKIGFQEYTIEQLSKVVYEQQKQIDNLEKRINFIIEKMNEPADIRNPEDEVPPHY